MFLIKISIFAFPKEANNYFFVMEDRLSRHLNEDYSLFLLIKKHDEEAFAAVYQKYHAYLYALALKYLKDEEMAEDALQYVFVKLWESAPRIELEVNLKNYLYTMLKNHVLNQIRNNKHTISIQYADAQEAFVDEDLFTEALYSKELSSLLQKGIEQLPPQKREVCQLKLEESISNQEIADRMGITIHTVKSHYQESLKMLRKYFEKVKMMLL